jgi:tryptophan-rich sensory protein
VRIPVQSSTTYRGRNSRPNLLVLFVFVLISLVIGGIGYLFSPARSVDTAHWYAALVKPDWIPPPQLFGPVWSALYLLMAVAAWMVWRERYHRRRNVALAVYALQLLLNCAWTPAFFGMKSLGIGLFVTIALWLAVAWTIREFARIRLLAAFVMLPYFIWCSIAVAMNYSLWKLNP